MMIRVMFRLFAENWHGKYHDQNHIRKAESRTIVSFFLSFFLLGFSIPSLQNLQSKENYSVRMFPYC